MPVVTDRDDERRRLTIIVSDPWSVEEIARSLERQLTDNTWKYATLYDLRGTNWVPTEPDVLWLVQHGDRKTARHGARGPIAVITTRSPQGRRLQQYAEYAGVQTRAQLRVFDDEVAATEWLTSATAAAPGT